jgi:uncharacterized membrane protein
MLRQPRKNMTGNHLHIKILSARSAFVLVWAVYLLFAHAANAQMLNQRDDSYPLLGLKRAKNAYDIVKADFERREKLFTENLISREEFDRARQAFSEAEVNFQQSLLAALFAKQVVSVDKAVKYQGKDGRKHVRLSLKNLSGASAELKKLATLDEEMMRLIQPDVINNVFVSLLNAENAVVSNPYESKLNQLTYGKSATLDFALLQDLDAVTVSLVYGNGTSRSPKIFLQKDETGNQVAIQSRVFSLEATLGAMSAYNLTLDMFGGMNSTFRFEVIGLPKEITYTFVDESTNTRVTQLKPSEGTTSRRVSLQLFLPDRASGDVKIDSTISFYVIVVPNTKPVALENLTTETGSPNTAAIEKLVAEKSGIGSLRLDLIPKGVGRVTVRAPQLYHLVKSGNAVTLTVDVVNEGSRRLDNIELKLDVPLGWTKTLTPPVVASLQTGEEKTVEIRLEPPSNTPVGKYEARLKTSARSESQPIYAEDKLITLDVPAEANVIGTSLLVLFILGLVGGMVFFGIRLSRR